MSIDRKRLLQGRLDALKASQNQNLPLAVRLGYKRAADHADAALGLSMPIAVKPKTKPQRGSVDEAGVQNNIVLAQPDAGVQ